MSNKVFLYVGEKYDKFPYKLTKDVFEGTVKEFVIVLNCNKEKPTNTFESDIKIYILPLLNDLKAVYKDNFKVWISLPYINKKTTKVNYVSFMSINNYYKAFINTLYKIIGEYRNNMMGFYFQNECPYVDDYLSLKNMSAYVHSIKKKLLWIPYVTKDPFVKNNIIKIINMNIFDELLIQPNLYFKGINTFGIIDTILQIKSKTNLGIQMELDENIEKNNYKKLYLEYTKHYSNSKYKNFIFSYYFGKMKNLDAVSNYIINFYKNLGRNVT